MSNGVLKTIDEIGKRWWLILVVIATIGSFYKMQFDFKSFKLTQEAYAQQITFTEAKFNDLEKSVIVLNTELPLLKQNVAEIKSDVKYVREMIEERY